MIQLGDVVKDKISGFTGVATCRLEYLNGCVRWAVHPRILHEGKPIEAQYFDTEQLDHVTPVEHVGFAKAVGATGGDRPAPPARG